MDLSGILSVTGHPGLFKLIGQMKNGMLVESLTDGKRMPAYATQRVLSLEEISIYTSEDDVPLADVFDLLAKKSDAKPALDPKVVGIDELRAYLKEVLPNYDEDRVYASDIKKLFQWYNLLAGEGLIRSEKKKKEKKEKKTEDPEKTRSEEKTETGK